MMVNYLCCLYWGPNLWDILLIHNCLNILLFYFYLWSGKKRFLATSKLCLYVLHCAFKYFFWDLPGDAQYSIWYLLWPEMSSTLYWTGNMLMYSLLLSIAVKVLVSLPFRSALDSPHRRCGSLRVWVFLHSAPLFAKFHMYQIWIEEFMTKKLEDI